MAEISHRIHNRNGKEEEEMGLEGHFHRLIRMLEDVEDEPNVTDEELLCGVMKSLEQEITSCWSTDNETSVEADIRSLDVEESGNEMGFPFIAMDDDLDIPPSPFLMELPPYSTGAQ
ncbi:hypothetical protein SUGI_1092820 [Cryptomeria japonica]|uniref:uncharacterized protein LOC131859471 n=1 Tax=Cryptomeria japonica TaxID=3369 RepID=UPI002414A0BC|nr:uncharacterized protein LOC131859471 [Cryptomeria japonica]GLJ51416.1 hypothetical protein SUGI_1092820 [Cryptomeria japonica]